MNNGFDGFARIYSIIIGSGYPRCLGEGHCWRQRSQTRSSRRIGCHVCWGNRWCKGHHNCWKGGGDGRRSRRGITKILCKIGLWMQGFRFLSWLPRTHAQLRAASGLTRDFPRLIAFSAMDGILREFEKLEKKQINKPLISTVDQITFLLEETKRKIQNGNREARLLGLT